jgi:parallel beta-helix repeat protein
MNRWLLLAALMLLMVVSDGKTLVVDPSAQGHPATLSRAVGMANPGDEIIVMPGHYAGVVIDRRLAIIGSGNVIINGNGNSALVISAPGCKLLNLSIEGSGNNPGVLLQSPDNLVERCFISGGSAGVQILGTNNTVRHGQVNSSLGIELKGSKCAIINEVFGGDKGIQIRDSSDNLIQDCRFSTATGLEMTSSTNNRIEKNNFSGIYFGITLAKSDRNWIAENQISGSFLSGFDLLESSSNNLSENRIEACKVGISVRQSEMNRLINNICQKNERAGIYINGSDDNQLMGNFLSGNGNGILLSSSRKNKIASSMATGNIYGISLRDCSQNILENNSLKANIYNLRID